MRNKIILVFLLTATILLGAVLPASADWVDDEWTSTPVELPEDEGGDSVEVPRVTEEAKYLGIEATKRPVEFLLPDCESRGAEQRAQSLMDLWVRAVWDAEIYAVNWTEYTGEADENCQNKSPVQLGDAIRYLRDVGIEFSQFIDKLGHEGSDAAGRYLQGAIITYRVWLANEEAPFSLKIFKDGSLAVGDGDTGHLFASAGSIDPEKLQALLPNARLSPIPTEEEQDLRAAQVLYSDWLHGSARESGEISTEKASAFLTYLRSLGLTFVAAEPKMEAAPQGYSVKLGTLNLTRITVLQDGSLLVWATEISPGFSHAGTDRVVLRTAPGSINLEVAEILLYSDYVRIYNENRLLKLGGLL